MAKPNYAFAKRQRDLAKKQKKEEKKQRKSSPTAEGGVNLGEPLEDQAAGLAGQGDELTAGQENLAEQANPPGAAAGNAVRQSGQV